MGKEAVADVQVGEHVEEKLEADKLGYKHKVTLYVLYSGEERGGFGVSGAGVSASQMPMVMA